MTETQTTDLSMRQQMALMGPVGNVLFGFCCLMVVALTVFAIAMFIERYRFVYEGERADATVIHRDSSRIGYRFTTGTGQVVEGGWNSENRNWQVGTQLSILYLPRQPQQNMPRRLAIMDAAGMFAFCLLALAGPKLLQVVWCAKVQQAAEARRLG